MPIYMTHPKHGATHVHSGQVEAHQENGWKLAEYPTYGKTEEIVSKAEKAKPGRKPKDK